MGQYTIVIHGTGAHHNWATEKRDGQIGDIITGRKNDYDADLMFAEFVDALKAKGHTVTGATFTSGGMEGADGVIRRDYVAPLQVDGWPRRSRVDYWSPAEHAISAAMRVVEEAGGSLKLTEAVNLLAKAQACVADHIESQPDPLRFKAAA